MTAADKLQRCRGCRNDFYNGRQNIGGRNCWSLKTAKPVTRWRLPWWTQPIAPGAFTEVKTLSCYHQPGQYAYYESLPAHAVQPLRLIAVEA